MNKIQKIQTLKSNKDVYWRLGYATGRHLITWNCFHCMLRSEKWCDKSLSIKMPVECGIRIHGERSYGFKK